MTGTHLTGLSLNQDGENITNNNNFQRIFYIQILGKFQLSIILYGFISTNQHLV